MRYYQKTSYHFLYWSFFPIAVYCIYFFEGYCMMGELRFDEFFIVLLCYVMLAASVVFQVQKERNLVKEIITNGRCYNGVVDKLIKMSIQTTFFRGTSSMEEKTAYYLQVVVDDCGQQRIFRSDVMIGNMSKHIEKNVKIYEDQGMAFVVCKKSKKKNKFEIEKRKEVETVSWNRAVLNFANRLSVFMFLSLIVVFLYAFFDNCVLI